LAEETGGSGENHQSVANHWQTLSHNVVSSTPRLSGIRAHNFSGRYNWNIVESGVKQHNPNPLIFCCWKFSCYLQRTTVWSFSNLFIIANKIPHTYRLKQFLKFKCNKSFDVRAKVDNSDRDCMSI
jgi:hypothetical protein